MSGQPEEASKKRACNFSQKDKDWLINVIYKYKNIIENKKTDAINNEKKVETWYRIAVEFNACSETVRGVQQLKKLYNNQKKILRENAADERTDILLTGGGITQKYSDKDLLLRSIVNEKTVDGMKNIFDGDHMELDSQNIEQQSDDVLPEPIFPNPLLLDTETENLKSPINAGPSTSQWKRYTPRQLRTPINTELKSNRRRPTPVVRALTSSDVAEKYNKLLDKRLSIANLTERQLENSIRFEEEKSDMEIKILKIELEIKQQKLKKYKSIVD